MLTRFTKSSVISALLSFFSLESVFHKPLPNNSFTGWRCWRPLLDAGHNRRCRNTLSCLGYGFRQWEQWCRHELSNSYFVSTKMSSRCAAISVPVEQGSCSVRLYVVWFAYNAHSNDVLSGNVFVVIACSALVAGVIIGCGKASFSFMPSGSNTTIPASRFCGSCCVSSEVPSYDHLHLKGFCTMACSDLRIWRSLAPIWNNIFRSPESALQFGSILGLCPV